MVAAVDLGEATVASAAVLAAEESLWAASIEDSLAGLSLAGLQLSKGSASSEEAGSMAITLPFSAMATAGSFSAMAAGS
jgi:hypothetical protein